MFPKRVEKYNIKYCDLLAAAKAGQIIEGGKLNLLNNIFASLPTFFLA